MDFYRGIPFCAAQNLRGCRKRTEVKVDERSSTNYIKAVAKNCPEKHSERQTHNFIVSTAIAAKEEEEGLVWRDEDLSPIRIKSRMLEKTNYWQDSTVANTL